MLLEAARSPAWELEGILAPLDQRDRSLWRRDLIEEGQSLVRQCVAINRPGPYQLQAAINAVHSDAASFGNTDWGQILALYGQLHLNQLAA